MTGGTRAQPGLSGPVRRALAATALALLAFLALALMRVLGHADAVDAIAGNGPPGVAWRPLLWASALDLLFMAAYTAAFLSWARALAPGAPRLLAIATGLTALVALGADLTEALQVLDEPGGRFLATQVKSVAFLATLAGLAALCVLRAVRARRVEG